MTGQQPSCDLAWLREIFAEDQTFRLLMQHHDYETAAWRGALAAAQNLSHTTSLLSQAVLAAFKKTIEAKGDAEDMSKASTSQQVPPIDPIEGALKSFMERLSRGDPDVLPELRISSQEHPEIWSQCGDLARQAEHAALKLLSGHDPVVQESVFRRAQELKAELAGPSATALEKLLAAQVVVDWLLLNLANQALLPNTTCGRSIPFSMTYSIREILHRQLTRSAQTLADVSRQLGRRGAHADIARLIAGFAADPRKGTEKTAARAAKQPASAPKL